MENLLQIKGNVKFVITIDPGVWIFDDRKIDLTTYFSEPHKRENSSYFEQMDNHWNKEIREGAKLPEDMKKEKKLKKQELLAGTFGISIEPFINNAEPLQSAKTLIIESKDGDEEIPLDYGKKCIAGFSKEGKRLSVDGPIHIYFHDGSNFDNPIKNVTGFTIK